MDRIFQAILQSKSLKAVHLDGNPCVSDKAFLEKLAEQAGAEDAFAPVNHIAHDPKIKPPGTRMAPREMQETLRLKEI